jgi:hypothetical protein
MPTYPHMVSRMARGPMNILYFVGNGRNGCSTFGMSIELSAERVLEDGAE